MPRKKQVVFTYQRRDRQTTILIAIIVTLTAIAIFGLGYNLGRYLSNEEIYKACKTNNPG